MSTPPCRFEDLAPVERRDRLADPTWASHAESCDSCRVFLALDDGLRAMLERTPPPPPRARWVYARARCLQRIGAGDRASFFGDLVARLLGALGLFIVAGLALRALHPSAVAPRLEVWIVIAGAVGVAFPLLSAVYRAWSES